MANTPFNTTFGMQPMNFGGAPPQAGPSNDPSVDTSHMDDPQFHMAFEQAIGSVPGLKEQMDTDPDLREHILQAVSQGPNGMSQAQNGMIMPSGGALPQTQQEPPGQPQGGGFKDYMNSQNGKDDMMMGLIMSNYGSNPGKALEMAMQFKQQKDQRRYQAEQNQMQRDATRDNMKLRADMEKQEKEDKQWMSERAKGIAQLQKAGLTEDDITAELGPWGKENSQASTSMVTQKIAEKKANEEKMKKDQTDFTNMEGIAGRVHTTGVITPSKYTNPTLPDGKPNPDYREDFVAALEGIASNRKALNDLHMANEKAHKKLMDSRARMLTGNLTDVQKESRRLQFTDLQNIFKTVMAAKKQIDTYQPFSEGNHAFGKAYQKYTMDYNEAMKEYKEKLGEMKGMSGAGLEEIATPGEEEVAEPTETPTASAPARKMPNAKQIRGFRHLMGKPDADAAALAQKWQEMFPGIAVPDAE